MRIYKAYALGPEARLQEDIVRIFAEFIAIFVIVDPFAVVPVYLLLTERFSPEAVVHTRRKASFVASGILITFAVTGMSIFHLFSITLPAFQIAGGILLLLLGISQLNATRTRVKPEETNESLERDDISVFPIGTPLLAGPGAISTVVLYASTQPSFIRVGGLIISISLAMGASYLTLKAAYPLFRVMGRTGLNLITRIMGLILTAVAVQFILNGLKGALQNLQVIP